MIQQIRLAQSEILEAVNDISAIYPEGEPFFDALDNFLIKTASENVYKALFMMAGKRTVIISGGFGKRVADGIDSGEFEKREYILFKGGLRTGNNPEIIKNTIELGREVDCVFLDDTIYGGNTYFKIQQYLKNEAPFLQLDNCIAVYDGCPLQRKEVSSIFRYYDHFANVKPNFQF